MLDGVLESSVYLYLPHDPVLRQHVKTVVSSLAFSDLIDITDRDMVQGVIDAVTLDCELALRFIKNW